MMPPMLNITRKFTECLSETSISGPYRVMKGCMLTRRAAKVAFKRIEKGARRNERTKAESPSL